jgi:hypothetical protein
MPELHLGEVFICGVCSEHQPIERDSGKVVYIGLYGTAWQVCLGCEEKVN